MENQKLLIFRQIKRELICANTLADRLQEYYSSSSNVATFREKAEAEAKELSSNSFGSSLLRVVGLLYMDVALEHINMTGRISSAIHQWYLSLRSYAKSWYYGFLLLSRIRYIYYIKKNMDMINDRISDLNSMKIAAATLLEEVR